MFEWKKSSYSEPNGGSCVEVMADEVAHVRDTKDRLGGEISFSPSAWNNFLTSLVNVVE